MSPSPALNVSDLIDKSSFGSFQLGLCILCGLCLVMDGFDVQAMGYVAPAILQEWHVPNAQFGPVFGAGLFGIFNNTHEFAPPGTVRLDENGVSR